MTEVQARHREAANRIWDKMIHATIAFVESDPDTDCAILATQANEDMAQIIADCEGAELEDLRKQRYENLADFRFRGKTALELTELMLAQEQRFGPPPPNFGEELESLRAALRKIESHGNYSGVIPCPQDHSFYIEPMRKIARAALSSVPPPTKEPR